MGPRHRIQTDQAALYKQHVRPGQMAHTIALNCKHNIKTYEIDTSVINRNPENK